MNRKRNVNYIKPEDPEFLKVLKKQAGYDDKNHKFDELQNAEDDFVEDEDSEQPQVVVLKKGDLTAEEADIEKKKIEFKETETPADLSQRVIFNSKKNSKSVQTTPTDKTDEKKRKRKSDNPKKSMMHDKKTRQLLSFHDDDDED